MNFIWIRNWFSFCPASSASELWRCRCLGIAISSWLRLPFYLFKFPPLPVFYEYLPAEPTPQSSPKRIVGPILLANLTNSKFIVRSLVLGPQSSARSLAYILGGLSLWIVNSDCFQGGQILHKIRYSTPSRGFSSRFPPALHYVVSFSKAAHAPSL